MNEVIKRRKSIRSFNGEKLSPTDVEKIKTYINQREHIMGPFGNTVSLDYIDYNGSKDAVKIGTYGFIKGHSGFVAGVCENTKEALVDYGYVFEKLVLFLTQEKIGTCWLGGTFTRKNLNTIIKPNENEIIPAITPVGYKKGKRRFTDQLIRKVAGSNNRLPYNELFYKDDFEHPLDEQFEALELVRMGPSASNKQPWRLVVDRNTVHFYIKRNENYSKALNYDMQLLDMGIAMCHYEFGCNGGKWIHSKPTFESDEKEYIISYRLK
ncbi:nitroreductase family protein [Haloplasma contractile]|uniref:Nitroreductase family protein n=1 Tax=Haloplasma contractile SSD-17B TaxID=1033810 RepID=U2FQ55_9MOLU|nr:nitroreductase family protein [Haloplasma contractile]ERJ13179.1 Nitroreductase family protein [Haloplasma contractile SSD-17B]